MSSNIISESSHKKGHISLKRYSALYFFSIIIDENNEHKTDDVVIAICNKFGIDSSIGHSSIDSKLQTILTRSGGINSIVEKYWECEIEGIVELYYRAIEYSYVSSNGIQYKYRWCETSTLVVNDNEIEEEDWDQNRIDTFIDDIEVLFSIRGKGTDKNHDHHSMFDIAWKRFEKGDKWKARDQMTYASFLINGFTPPEGSKDYFDVLKNGYIFITKKWFSYLWECKESKKQESYILSLKEFVSRNQESWSTTKENKTFHNRIYTTEHEEIRKQFVKESEILYKTLWDLT